MFRGIVVEEQTWVYFLSPLATLVAALVGIVAAFLVGRYQGRAQTQHDESVRVVVEVRQRTLAVIAEMKTWPEPAEEDAPEDIDHWPAMRQVRDLVAYYQANTPWLDRQTIDNIDPIINGLASASWEAVERWAQVAGRMDIHREYAKLIEDFDEAKAEEYPDKRIVDFIRYLKKPVEEPKVADLVTERLEPLEAQLAVEARRLIGTDKSRWRRLFS